MKKTTLFLSTFLSIAMTQDTLFVEWSSEPDHLKNVIIDDRDSDDKQMHDVYLLEANKIYFQASKLELYGSLNITGKTPVLGEHPATIQPIPLSDGSNGFEGWPRGNFDIIGDGATLTLRGLILNQVMQDGSGSLDGVAYTRADEQKIYVENCVISGCQALAFASFGTSSDFHFINSVAKAWVPWPGQIFFGGLFWGAGSWMGTVDTFVVENSTVHDLTGEAIVLYEHVDYGMINRSTFANINMGVVWFRGQNNLTVKNNLFYNTKSYGQSQYDVDNWGIWEPGGNGQMSVMPKNGHPNYYDESYWMSDGQYVDMNDRNINYHNNVWYHDDQMVDYMQTDPWSWEVSEYDDDGTLTNTYTQHDTMLAVVDQSKWIDDSTVVAIEQGNGVTESDNIHTDPEIALDPMYVTAA